MSALDPTAAALLAAVNAADTAFLETVLDLGVSAQVLQAQISVGDLLPALVLKPENGVDAIELAGKRVAAQLPPDVRPGQTLVLQVMAFDGNRIVVRNLGPVDPQNAPASPLLTPRPSSATPSVAPPVDSASSQADASSKSTPPAPAREIFAAASVRSVPKAASPENTGATAARPLPQTAFASRAAALDARIAAAQTPRGSAVAPPPASPAPAAAIASASRAAHTVARNAVPPPIATIAQATRTTSDVLRAARLPDTAFTRTVAAVAHQAPQRLAQVFARLDQVLAHVSSDPRAASLRTLAAFTGRFNLANIETLPAQIGAYVSHVVQGAEGKLVALLQAYRATTPEQAQASQQHAQVSSATFNSGTPQHGRIAQSTAEIEHDLKTLILSLIKEPPAQRSPALAQALNESLITVTATQLNVLNANQGESAAVTLPLPAFFYEGGKPAYLRINRDASNAAHPISGDNFHIAFILDTKHLGTVAVDLQTSSRTVKVDVKAEHSRAASAFAGTLSSLKDRLETLRYRVSAVTANVAPKTGAATKKERPSAQLDLHA